MSAARPVERPRPGMAATWRALWHWFEVPLLISIVCWAVVWGVLRWLFGG